ncbi:MAG: pyridoxamine 5'-phosphate oxidase [Actinobacteria bacterium]|nr:pyridoxamine 5'-phosphate oxidase [Actinomycetota bacterium]
MWPPADPHLLDLRRDYESPPLHRADLDPDPVRQFRRWYAEWEASGALDPNAVVLATATAEGVPSARYVLLKAVDDDGGFVVFTNLASRKGRELSANPGVALCFGWLAQHRQVRVEGRAVVVPDEVADAYFASRPRSSRIAAWASEQQSAPVESREALERRFADVERRYPGDVPRPPTWTGVRVVADAVEVWQGRRDRMHDRFRYERSGTSWTLVRLTP